eukprot:COSAG02_NODE_394_length_23152_cov_13.232204_11_plen_286_part_00
MAMTFDTAWGCVSCYSASSVIPYSIRPWGLEIHETATTAWRCEEQGVELRSAPDESSKRSPGPAQGECILAVGPPILGAGGAAYLKLTAPYHGCLGYIPLKAFTCICCSDGSQTWKCISKNPAGIGIRLEPDEASERAVGPRPGERIQAEGVVMGKNELNDVAYLRLTSRFKGHLGYVPLLSAYSLKTTDGTSSTSLPYQPLFAKDPPEALPPRRQVGGDALARVRAPQAPLRFTLCCEEARAKISTDGATVADGRWMTFVCGDDPMRVGIHSAEFTVSFLLLLK